MCITNLLNKIMGKKPVDPNALILNGVSGQKISGRQFDSILLTNCQNIEIIDCEVNNAPSIIFNGCTDINFSNNKSSGCLNGIYANNCKGGLNISDNIFINLVGLPFVTGQQYNLCHAIQLDTCTGTGNVIDNNKIDNQSEGTGYNDLINIYSSMGTKDSPIKVTNNWLRGGKQGYGAGIQMGDSGGPKTASSGYQLAQNNIIVNTGGVGLSVGGGTNITIDSNKIFSELTDYSNVGMDIENYYPKMAMNNIIVINNIVNWLSKNGQNAWYVPKNAGNIDMSTNKINSSLLGNILPVSFI